MKHADFEIGFEFLTGSDRWRCTDVGTRVITAIKISEVTVTAVSKDGTKTTHTDNPPDPSWFNGPPYAVAEYVFDEYDMMACRKSQP